MRRGLRLQKVLREAPEFLEPAECRKLLEAALRHDADTYTETREEHRGERIAGTTYQCNAPGLFGDAAAFRSAMRLGHSVVVSEKRYADQFAVSRDARTLEQAQNRENPQLDRHLNLYYILSCALIGTHAKQKPTWKSTG